jgi:hypothetical protein
MVLTDKQKASNGKDGSKIYQDVDGNYVYGDLTSLPEISGQNTYTPSQKAFTTHIIVKILLNELSAASYYDPSYGKIFTRPQDFETNAIFGYWKEFKKDTDKELYWHYRVRKPTEQTNIKFKSF